VDVTKIRKDVVIYGRPKSGKTTLALSYATEKPTVVFSPDRGTNWINGDFETIDVTSFQQLILKLEKFLQQNDNDKPVNKKPVLVVDGLSKVYDWALYDAVAAGDKQGVRRAGPGMPVLQDYGSANSIMGRFFYLVRSYAGNVTMICQEKTAQDDEGETVIGPQLPAKLTTNLLADADMIIYQYVTKGNKEKPPQYISRVAPRSDLLCGVRSATYDGTPAAFANTNLNTIFEKVWNNED